MSLLVSWQRGWSAARELPPAEDVGGALRSHCLQLGRDIEFFAYDDDPTVLGRLAGLVLREDGVTWLTVPTHDPVRTAAALQEAGLVLLKSSELLMTADLRTRPEFPVPDPYRLEVERSSTRIQVRVLDRNGAVGAYGTMGLTGTDAIADRITTEAGHRRRGLGSAVMSALTREATEATRGILIASEDGQRLYPKLGWRGVANVLIAAAPG